MLCLIQWISNIQIEDFNISSMCDYTKCDNRQLKYIQKPREKFGIEKNGTIL